MVLQTSLSSQPFNYSLNSDTSNVTALQHVTGVYAYTKDNGLCVKQFSNLKSPKVITPNYKLLIALLHAVVNHMHHCNLPFLLDV